MLHRLQRISRFRDKIPFRYEGLRIDPEVFIAVCHERDVPELPALRGELEAVVLDVEAWLAVAETGGGSLKTQSLLDDGKCVRELVEKMWVVLKQSGCGGGIGAEDGVVLSLRAGEDLRVRGEVVVYILRAHFVLARILPWCLCEWDILHIWYCLRCHGRRKQTSCTCCLVSRYTWPNTGLTAM